MVIAGYLVIRGSLGILQVAGRACGRLESWDKWSFAGEQVRWGSTDLPGWRPVHKLISRFSAASGHGRTRVRGLGEEPECHVELTEVHMRGQAWWTLGFERPAPAAYGAANSTPPPSCFPTPCPEA